MTEQSIAASRAPWELFTIPATSPQRKALKGCGRQKGATARIAPIATPRPGKNSTSPLLAQKKALREWGSNPRRVGAQVSPRPGKCSRTTPTMQITRRRRCRRLQALAAGSETAHAPGRRDSPSGKVVANSRISLGSIE